MTFKNKDNLCKKLYFHVLYDSAEEIHICIF